MSLISLDEFATISLAIAIPWLFAIRQSWRSSSTTATHSLVLLTHTLLILYTLLVQRPPNLFKALKIPVNQSTDAIRAHVLQHSGIPELNPELEGLLKRLASFDTRALYPRFGHNVVATCTYCQSFEDFLLYALPRSLLSYIREIAFMGLLTSFPTSPAKRFRKSAVAALVLMGVAEAYVLATITIKIPPRGSNESVFMWHDNLFLLRNVIFLALPFIMIAMPSHIPFLQAPASSNFPSSDPSLSTSFLLTQTLNTTSHILQTLHLLKYAYAATMRLPPLRSRAAGWWEEEARVGETIRNDSDGATSVRNVARALGIGFDDAGTFNGLPEGPLKTAAKAAVGTLMGDGMTPSEHWRAQ